MSFEKHDLELAGLELRSDLLLPAPQSDGWEYGVAPRCWISDEPLSGADPNPDAYPVLEWRFAPDEEPVRRANASTDCIREFTELTDGPSETFPQRVLNFAKAWGPLGICRHGKPSGHDPDCWPLGTFQGWDDEEGNPYWEPIEAWHRYSRQLDALLSVAVELQQGRPGRREDWDTMNGAEPYRTDLYRSHGLRGLRDEPRHGQPGMTSRPGRVEVTYWAPPATATSAEDQRLWLALALDKWLIYGEVRPQSHWLPTESSVGIRLAYHGLPGVLAVQLAATLTSPRGLYRCVGCHRAFIPAPAKRRPRRGTRPWCGRSPDCDRAAQQRDWARRNPRQRKEAPGDEPN